MQYVYVLKSNLDELYYGQTSDLKKRAQHNSGKSFSTKGQEWKLIYYEAYLSVDDAHRREKQLKYHGQALDQLKRRISDSLGKS